MPWVPVMVWLGVLCAESSRYGSTDNTATYFRKLWIALLGPPNEALFAVVHHDIRKSLHFLAYAFLSILIFRALRNAWRNQQAIAIRTREYYWQLRWAVIAMAGTLAAAVADEIHQTFIPGRTGVWQDVVIDCSGALVFQVLLYLWGTSRNRGSQAREVNAEA